MFYFRAVFIPFLLLMLSVWVGLMGFGPCPCGCGCPSFPIESVEVETHENGTTTVIVVYAQEYVEWAQARIQRTIAEIQQLGGRARENSGEHAAVLRQFIELAMNSAELDGQIDMAIVETFVETLDALFEDKVFSEELLDSWLNVIAQLLIPMRDTDPKSDQAGVLQAFVQAYLSEEGAWLSEGLRERARSLLQRHL